MRHKAVVGLVDRATRRGWVTKQDVAPHRQLVRVEPASQGKRILMKPFDLHHKELPKFQVRLASSPEGRQEMPRPHRNQKTVDD